MENQTEVVPKSSFFKKMWSGTFIVIGEFFWPLSVILIPITALAMLIDKMVLSFVDFFQK